MGFALPRCPEVEVVSHQGERRPGKMDLAADRLREGIAQSDVLQLHICLVVQKSCGGHCGQVGAIVNILRVP